MSAGRFRHEDKYILDNMQAGILKARARAIMRPDAHVTTDGSYTIKSLYFDDINNGCFFDSENGNDPRAKFRIRIYNNDTSMIRLEKKIKQNGLTLKQSAQISIEEAGDLMSGNPITLNDIENEGKKTLISEMNTRGLFPVIIIEYKRLPYVYPSTDIRFTIDERIICSTDIKSFLDTDRKAAMRARAGSYIMELKWNSFIPGIITEYLSLNTLQRTRFSKYYYCRSMTF